jgi:hypothetical protein
MKPILAEQPPYNERRTLATESSSKGLWPKLGSSHPTEGSPASLSKLMARVARRDQPCGLLSPFGREVTGGRPGLWVAGGNLNGAATLCQSGSSASGGGTSALSVVHPKRAAGAAMTTCTKPSPESKDKRPLSQNRAHPKLFYAHFHKTAPTKSAQNTVQCATHLRFRHGRPCRSALWAVLHRNTRDLHLPANLGKVCREVKISSVLASGQTGRSCGLFGGFGRAEARWPVGPRFCSCPLRDLLVLSGKVRFSPLCSAKPRVFYRISWTNWDSAGPFTSLVGHGLVC